MRLTDQVLAQALLLAGPLEERQQLVLGALCHSTTASLKSRLRDGLTEEDCKADFVAAASLYALAALKEAGQPDTLEEFRAGDLTIRRNSADTASQCLHRQAELIMMPFLKDGFVFRGV